jgi:uncharacterized protein YgbK (DUF1537 family)
MSALECLLIADDLTGACDAAVHFAMRGYRTTASVGPCTEGDASVIAINAATRRLDPQQAEQRMFDVAAAGLSPRLLFKKVDSVLRGHAGREVVAALTAFGYDAAIFTPAFPALGRTVESGWLVVDGRPTVEIAPWLGGQGVANYAHVCPGEIAEAIAGGARVVSLDTSSDLDLDAIIAEGRSLGTRVLWAGSGGLAAALARSLPPGPGVQCPRRKKGAVLFCIGTDHPVTLKQQERLIAERSVRICGASSAAEIATSLRNGEHGLLRVPCEGIKADLLNGALAAAFLLTGGDTASAICEVLGANSIELYDEIAPGVPRGVLRGGALDGIAVITKSGGFGGADVLVKVADFFS